MFTYKQYICCAGANYEPEMLDKAYRVVMKLNIRAINPSDFGVYMCVAKNALGVTDGSIKVYSKCFTELVWFCSISLVVVVHNIISDFV